MLAYQSAPPSSATQQSQTALIENNPERNVSLCDATLYEHARLSVLISSKRCDLIEPVAANDAEIHSIFNHAPTMQATLPSLMNMDEKAWRARREIHRLGFLCGTSCFMDVRLRESYTLIGTSGFRTIEDGKAEWGVVIHSDFQRRGICTELFHVCLLLLASRFPQVKLLLASTLPANAVMRRFLKNQGMVLVRQRVTEGGWIDYELPLDSSSSPSTDVFPRS
jgi:RimJ/RimL family protein N-acetyltransferase